MSLIYTLNLPADFDEFAWETEKKGWLPQTTLTVGGNRYTLLFYDPVRLAQEIDDELQKSSMFLERNLVVVKSVTRAHIEAAIAEVVRTGRHKEMIPD